MSKRGQATIIIFLAIIIVVVIVLLFFLVKSKVYIGGTNVENLRRELDPIAKHIEKCLYDLTTQYAAAMGQQGGYLEQTENTYLLYNSQKISFLCFNTPKIIGCSNRYLRLNDMESQLKLAIISKLDSCININSFKKSGFSITPGNKDLQIDISPDNIITSLSYPIKIKKDNSEVEVSTFSKAVPLPLGRLYSAAMDIVNLESLTDKFDTVVYSVIKSQLTGKPYIIQKLQPYPNKVYILKIKDIPEEANPYVFQFSIEGEGK